MSSEEPIRFIETANKLNKKFWIRQVIVPGIMDNDEYLHSLKEYIKKINKIAFNRHQTKKNTSSSMVKLHKYKNKKKKK